MDNSEIISQLSKARTLSKEIQSAAIQGDVFKASTYADMLHIVIDHLERQFSSLEFINLS